MKLNKYRELEARINKEEDILTSFQFIEVNKKLLVTSSMEGFLRVILYLFINLYLGLVIRWQTSWKYQY